MCHPVRALRESQALAVAAVVVLVALAGCIGSSGDDPSAGATPGAGDDEETSPQTNTGTDGTEGAKDAADNATENQTRTWTTNESIPGNVMAPVGQRVGRWVESNCNGLEVRNIRPPADVRAEGVNYNNHTFELEETVRSLQVNLTWTNQASPPALVGELPNLDLCLYNATGAMVNQSSSWTNGEAVGYQLEPAEERGTWTAKVYNFRGVDVDYTLDIVKVHEEAV